MTKARLLIFGLWILFGAFGRAPGASSQPPLSLTQQVLDLGLERTRHSPFTVRIQGFVTYPDAAANMIYVQDSSAGIRVVYTNVNYQPASGQMVEVEGTAVAGLFAPFVDCSNIRVIGVGPIPEPCVAPAARMVAGELFGQWVQVEGVVRDVAKESERAFLFVSSGGLRFHAVIQPFSSPELPVEWLDARMVLRGVCWTDVDAENKPTGFTLYIPGTEHLFVVQPGAPDIFRQPSLSLNLHPELRRQSDARVKVSGVVAFHSPSGHIYLQGDGGAICARLLVPLVLPNPQARYRERPPLVPLRPGERVEMVGAPTASSFAPLLQDAEFRRIGEGPAPAPTAVSVGEVFSGRFDGQLISLKARLLASEQRQVGALKHQILALQTGDTIFEALWEYAGTNTLPPLAKNSYLQASGICAVQLGELNQIRSFRLLVRDPADLHLLGRPPWWEPLPLVRMLAAAIGLATVSLGWIWLLRRQVSQRTAELRAEVAERHRAQTELHQALAAERELGELRTRFVSMVSHEFRTPLGVILSATENLESYFERLKPEQRRKQLQSVIQATRHMAKVMENVLLLGRAEAGKLEFKAAPFDVVKFCETLTHQLESSTGSKCPIHFHSVTLPIATGAEPLLRHILSNLLTNAVKYSPEGTPVEFSLDRRNGDAIFCVQDRGIGIPSSDQKQLFQAFHRGANVSHLPGTGLGLVIVKRCVELHGGQIRCVSAEGAGTTFTVALPLFP